MAKNNDKYTDPQLRSEIKEEVQAGDKGGNPGQWSARKAQMMASKYKGEMHKRGEEPYTTDKSDKSENQKHLSNWTDEDWQTSDGKAEAMQDDGSMKRYLPKKAWENMSEQEKKETDEKKQNEGSDGKQFVRNTEEAKNARKEAQTGSDKKDADGEGKASKAGRRKHGKDQSKVAAKDDVEDTMDVDDAEEGAEADAAGGVDDAEFDADEKTKSATKKAKTNGGAKRVTRSMTNGKSEKPRKGQTTKKDTGKGKAASGQKLRSKAGKRESKGEEEKSNEDSLKENKGKTEEGDGEHGQPASASRLPEKGQHVFWRATPGWVEGTVVEILRSNESIDGIHVNASEDDPRIALKSSKSGKTAIHKPSAVYF